MLICFRNLLSFYALNYKGFFCLIYWNQANHQITTRMQRRLYSHATDVEIRPLNEEKAVQAAVDLIGELFVFSVILLLVTRLCNFSELFGYSLISDSSLSVHTERQKPKDKYVDLGFVSLCAYVDM